VNREVIYALRPGISEGHVVDNHVLTALVNATARKYKVERNDVYQDRQIAEELVKEIMDSSFISSATKKTYCETLAHLVRSERASPTNSESRVERLFIETEFRKKQNERLSAVLGMTAATGTLLAALNTVFDKQFLSSNFKNAIDIAFPTFAVLASVMIAAATMLIGIKFKSGSKERKEAKPSTDEEIS